MTDAQIEAGARAAYFAMHSIMHDHEIHWRQENKLRGNVWRDVAIAVITAANAPEGN